MRFEIEVNGRARVVTVERADPVSTASRLRVTIQHRDESHDAVPDEVHIVDATETDLGWSMVYGADGRSVDAAVTRQKAGYFVQLPHIALDVGLDGRHRPKPTPGSAQGGERRVLAPMPGRILRVLVKVGDLVEARQGLVVMEAMKMENELTIAEPGRVKEITVAEGASVEAGRVLVIVE